MLSLCLEREKGYFTCNKTKLNFGQLNNYDGIPLKKNGNSFGWDIAAKEGKYFISLFIKWLSDTTTIKHGAVSLLIQNNNTKDVRKIKNSKLSKAKGNKLTFGEILLPNSESLYIRFESKVELMIDYGIIEYNGTGVRLLEPEHSGGRLRVEDVSNEDTIAFYREVSISRHVPYTNYTVAFQDGCFQLQMDGTRTGIMFNVVHDTDYKSFVIASNARCLIRDTEDDVGILFPNIMRVKTSYKVFMKIQHDNYDGQSATFYHAFCGSVGKNNWAYMGTICRAGHHEMGEISGNLHIEKHNGHLYTRVFKYGNGWNFDKFGRPMTVDEVKCYSSNGYTNSRTEFDNSTSRIKMFLGGGIHTTTPNESYKIKRSHRSVPMTPFSFNISEHVSDSELLDDVVSDIPKTNLAERQKLTGSPVHVQNWLTMNQPAKPTEITKIEDTFHNTKLKPMENITDVKQQGNDFNESVQNKLGNTRNSFSDTRNDFNESVQNKLGDTRNSFSDTRNDFGESVQSKLSDTRNSFNDTRYDLEDEFDGVITEKPIVDDEFDGVITEKPITDDELDEDSYWV